MEVVNEEYWALVDLNVGDLVVKGCLMRGLDNTEKVDWLLQDRSDLNDFDTKLTFKAFWHGVLFAKVAAIINKDSQTVEWEAA